MKIVMYPQDENETKGITQALYKRKGSRDMGKSKSHQRVMVYIPDAQSRTQT